MSVVRIASALLTGLDVQAIGVEVDVRKGLPNFTVVGLAQDAVRESRDRVIAAIKNSGFEMPRMKVTVNLTPVTLRKASELLDVPIAVGILTASDQIPPPDPDCIFLGEVSLDGTLRPASGLLALLDGLSSASSVVIPESNLPEAGLIQKDSKRKHRVRGLGHLSALCAPVDHLSVPPRSSRKVCSPDPTGRSLDFADIRGQHLARRAAEIAAAGGHHLILIGPPGTGKSMLAQRLPTILPEMSPSESLDVTKIYSVAGLMSESRLVRVRPFRSPHHTLSEAALVGGGPKSLPGEITLAHRGVLFLDEFPEFHRSCIESLRQPMEDRTVLISRAALKVSYPADFLLVCAMNPCPCGYLNHPTRSCRCAAADIRRYNGKLSGPILNRIDLQVELSSENPELILSDESGESSTSVRKRVESARAVQSRRFGKQNSRMTPSEVREHCVLSPECRSVLQSALQRLNLSPRSLEKVVKVSRTIADLAGDDAIRPEHLLEAVQFRPLDMLTSAST